MNAIRMSKKVWDNFNEQEKTYAKILMPLHGVTETKIFFKAAKKRFGSKYKLYGRKLAVDAPGKYMYEWSKELKIWRKYAKKPDRNSKVVVL